MGFRTYLIDFDDIFSKGIDLLFDLKNGTRVSNEDNREPWTFCMIFSKRKVSVSRDLVVVVNTRSLVLDQCYFLL